MFYRALSTTSLITALLVSAPAMADDAQAEALFEALGLPDIVDIMREEGTSYGAQIATDLFPSGLTSSWSATVEAIYNPDEMLAAVKADFAQALEGDDVEAMLAFFVSPLGQNVVALEVAARRALLDDAVSEASKDMANLARADNTPRFVLVDEFVQTNDLIETNVVGALNSNFAFYKGLAEGGAFDETLTEQQILTDVWAQEPDIRTSTQDWVYSFLLMAYDPISDAELQTYIDFSKSEAGRQLNGALFDAFDDHFDGVSQSLGREAARVMSGAEL